MKRSAWGLVLLAAALLAAPRPARADDTEKEKEKTPTPEGEPELRYPPPSTRWKVLAAGVILTGGAWGVSFGCAEEWPWVDPRLQPKMPTFEHPLIPSGPPETPWLKVPVIGPWVALSKLGCGSDQIDCGPATGARVAAYIIDGIVQLGGLALITEGIVMKTESEAPKASALTFQRGSFSLTPAPVITTSMSGLGFSGTF